MRMKKKKGVRVSRTLAIARNMQYGSTLFGRFLSKESLRDK